VQIPTIAKEIDYNPMGMIFELCHSRNEVVEALGKDAEYLMGVTPWTYSVNSVDTYTGWSSADFKDKYSARYHMNPPDVAASTFASAVILMKVIESTQSLEADVLMAALSQEYFETFYANITFDQHKQASFDVLVVQVSDT
jgi:hypothetical protein